MGRKKITSALLISVGLHVLVLFFFWYDFNLSSVERAAGKSGSIEWITVSLVPATRSTTVPLPTVSITPAGNSDQTSGDSQGEGGEGGENGTSEILRQIRLKIERAKYYPLTAKRKGIAGNPVVQFKILGNGSLEYVRLVQTSGNAQLDEAAVRTIQLAMPLPFHPEPVKIGIEYSLSE